MRLLVAVRHLNVFPKSSLLARNNSKRWALGAKGGLAMQHRAFAGFRLISAAALVALLGRRPRRSEMSVWRYGQCPSGVLEKGQKGAPKAVTYTFVQDSHQSIYEALTIVQWSRAC